MSVIECVCYVSEFSFFKLVCFSVSFVSDYDNESETKQIKIKLVSNFLNQEKFEPQHMQGTTFPGTQVVSYYMNTSTVQCR